MWREIDWSNVDVLSNVLNDPFSSHEEIDPDLAERIIVARDDSAHVVRNITGRGDDDPQNQRGVWIKLCECEDTQVALKIAMLLRSRG